MARSLTLCFLAAGYPQLVEEKEATGAIPSIEILDLREKGQLLPACHAQLGVAEARKKMA